MRLKGELICLYIQYLTGFTTRLHIPLTAGKKRPVFVYPFVGSCRRSRPTAPPHRRRARLFDGRAGPSFGGQRLGAAQPELPLLLCRVVGDFEGTAPNSRGAV